MEEVQIHAGQVVREVREVDAGAGAAASGIIRAAVEGKGLDAYLWSAAELAGGHG